MLIHWEFSRKSYGKASRQASGWTCPLQPGLGARHRPSSRREHLPASRGFIYMNIYIYEYTHICVYIFICFLLKAGLEDGFPETCVSGNTLALG